MNKKKIFVIVITGIIIGAGAGFYGGMKYEQSSIVGQRSQAVRQFGANASANIPGRRVNGLPASATPKALQAGQAGQNFISGDIIAKDDKSIIIKLRDGGSKIVFFLIQLKSPKQQMVLPLTLK